MPDQYAAASPVSPARSARFYYETVVFEVEGTLYSVLKHILQNWSRSVLRDMFALPQGPPGNQEGESDANPIRLVGCTKVDFESLLEVVYSKMNLTGSPTTQSPELSKMQWIGVLRVSRMWDMPEAATIAIQALDAFHLTPIEKVNLGGEHGVPKWLKDGYATLIGDTSASTFDELKTLGSDVACLILFAQTQVHLAVKRDDLYCGYCMRSGKGAQRYTGTGRGIAIAAMMPPSAGLPTTEVESKVTQLFGKEIKAAEGRHTA